MTNIPELLRTAAPHHRAGRLAEAQRIYQQVLDLDPCQFNALHMLGVIAGQNGQCDRACELIGKAIAQRPAAAVAHNNLGKALQAQGNLEQAISSHRRALEIKPDFAEAHCALGAALKAQGNLSEAAAEFQRALEIKPDLAAARENLANMPITDGPDTTGHVATTSAEAVDDSKRREATQHFEVGLKLLNEDKPREAIASFREALNIQPDNALAYNSLGVALTRIGRVAAAEKNFRQAVDLNPRRPGLRKNLGNTLLQLNRSDDAIEQYQQALRLKPRFAEAHFFLGTALQSQGKFDEAEQCYRRALDIRPDYGEVYGRLTAFQSFAYGGETTIEEIKRLLQSEALGPESRRHLHFALGKIYDDAQQWDDAFAHIQQGNQLTKTEFNLQHINRDVDMLLSTCTRDLLARGATIGLQTELPVLIVGMPRSGTTLVEQILASHPAVYGAGELSEFEYITLSMQNAIKTQTRFPACLAELDGPTAVALANHYVSQLKALSPDAERVTDKMPGNFANLGVIAMLLPTARVIHTRRDPLDTCLSCYVQNFGNADRLGYAFDFQSLGVYYRAYQRLMEHWRQVLPLRMLEVDYEELVANQEGVSRQLVEFCGLDWDPACLEFHKTRRAVQTASNWQVRQPLYSRSVGRWKYYEKHLQPLKAALGL